jgi:hypothetical protein
MRHGRAEGSHLSMGAVKSSVAINITEIPILRLERAKRSENVAKIGNSQSFAVRFGVF